MWRKKTKCWCYLYMLSKFISFLQDIGVSHICDGIYEQTLDTGLLTLVLWNNQLTYQSMSAVSKALVIPFSIHIHQPSKLTFELLCLYNNKNIRSNIHARFLLYITEQHSQSRNFKPRTQQHNQWGHSSIEGRSAGQ